MEQTLRTSFILLLALLFVLRGPAGAEEQQAPIIKQIDIRGNQKVESDAIRQRIETRVGDPFSPEKIREEVERLFKMGFFDDVMVEAEEFEGGLRLIYVVKEKPSIRLIQIEGAEELDEEDIRDRIDVAAGSVFEPQAIGRNVGKIRAFYEEEGFYTAQVVGRTERVSDRELDIIFEIQEGDEFFIRDITFVGNEGLSDGKLSGIMATNERFFIPFFGAGVLKRSDLEQDGERIKALYLNEGYLEVKVAEPEIQVDKEANRLDIVIRIEEGARFRVGKVQVVGSKIFTPEELLATLKLPEEEFFNRDTLRKDLANVTAKYSELGYVFADVVPVTRVQADEEMVNVSLEITEGVKTFVERIEIRGNTKTRDKVIRRQMELSEGDVYNGTLLREARAALQGLGYFEGVEIKTARGSAADQLELTIDVKERPTGRLGFGGGFSTGGGAIGSIFLSEGNLFGTGRRISLNATLGTVTSALDFRYDDPFFLDSKFSMGIGIFNRVSSFDEFDEQRRGAEIVFGRQFLRYNFASLGYLFETVDISDVQDTASEDIRDQEGETTTSSLNLLLTRAVLNNPVRPSKGYRVSLSSRFAGGFLGGDNDFYKFLLDSRYYVPLLEDLEVVGMLRARGGFVDVFGGLDEVPLQERFFLGGPNAYRGSKFRELSPIDPSTGERVGGDTFVLFTGEVSFPILKELLKLNGAVFFDAANNWAEFEDVDFDLEYAVGVGIGVVTPFGPIRIDLAYNPEPDARTGNDDFLFHLNFGRAF
ncbi:MAG: outer membrane protein assembly factor BamA [candidate division NC10 bacterium]|nr:outer membrane protein assembly factor BamA [candidate division NC10 bacterium]